MADACRDIASRSRTLAAYVATGTVRLAVIERLAGPWAAEVRG